MPDMQDYNAASYYPIEDEIGIPREHQHSNARFIGLAAEKWKVRETIDRLDKMETNALRS